MTAVSVLFQVYLVFVEWESEMVEEYFDCQMQVEEPLQLINGKKKKKGNIVCT